jgi:formylglycine-generating enzyme required for sulfatase activity
MTHREIRSRLGADIARRVVVGCGLKPNSLRQLAVLDREIPLERRLCLASNLEALAGDLTQLARELREIYMPEEWTNSLGMFFRRIPAGTFQMGGNSDTNTNQPIHQVHISKPFYLGKYPVTQAEWQAVMGSNPAHFKGTNRPVETVSWEEAQAFIAKLNAREPCDRYRLPTEAEWEYACRGGSELAYSFGDDASLLGEYAWYDGNSGNETHPVGEKLPNGWGLHDMHGNVWEWVQDWYDENYYRNSPGIDPVNEKPGSLRVIRGGSWDDAPRYLRSAYRGVDTPGYRGGGLGFRLLRV